MPDRERMVIPVYGGAGRESKSGFRDQSSFFRAKMKSDAASTRNIMRPKNDCASVNGTRLLGASDGQCFGPNAKRSARHGRRRTWANHPGTCVAISGSCKRLI